MKTEVQFNGFDFGKYLNLERKILLKLFIIPFLSINFHDCSSL
jgi:hypothetical protein